MIERYTLPEMGAIWSEENRYRKWLEVELAVCQAWARLGKIPPKSLENIRKKAAFSVQRIEEIEKVVKHDVIAFLTSVAEYIGDDSRFVHMGLTSYDVVDTALSLLMVESLDRVEKRLLELRKILKKKALKYKKTPCIGRTHGVHAEPITFGFKILVWYEETNRHLKRLKAARETISVGRIAGSVGTYIHLDPRVEKYALKSLGLKPAPVSTQVLQRDRHAEVMSCLALIVTSLEKFALEIRHLQKTEVLEVEEPFTRGQKGSSAMPHKRNPVRCERVAGLARIVRGNLQVALENIPLWHERDISHSSAERVIFPDSFILTDYLLKEMAEIIGNWHVYPARMMQNIQATRGLIFSQAVMLALTRKGLSREEAYRLVQACSLKAWQENLDFRELVSSDPEITRHLSPREIESCFSLEPYLQKIDFIFERVLR
ncbi:MAG: Adenylosuccinate lyase [Candidatus Saccharicenans subterraneus]|uniref:Adenylosuccinate lyase n=1 Tax=Candidatus Saccharicenans subterraneus TaxID=2508984 RepID=A0A3E2BME8_9BACT|nr:MAG: Adenylosuccinate lyase [Candidatus Saccharicenans subterraneum]